jgi:hypothetical protein
LELACSTAFYIYGAPTEIERGELRSRWASEINYIGLLGLILLKSGL